MSPKLIKSLSDEFDVHYYPTQSADFIQSLKIQCDYIICRSRHQINRAWLNSFLALKGVIRAGSGMNNICIDSLKERGVKYCNFPDVNTRAVAEYAIGILICTYRHLFSANSMLKKGVWDKKNFMGHELSGKTVGLIGVGNIGKALAKLLQVFEVKVLYANKSNTVVEEIQGRLVSLDELCGCADIICVQVPLNKSTYQLVDSTLIDRMVKKPIILNLSRFDVFEFLSVVKAAEEGRIRAAIIDPVEKEHMELISTLQLENMIMMPHLGGNTFESQDRLLSMIEKKLDEWSS